jgi:hypothetical protein
VVGKLDGGSWSLPTVNDRQATSITASGMASFSSFAVGEPGSDLAISGSGQPDPIVAGTTLTYVLSVSNSGPADAAAVTVTATFAPELGSATYCTGTGCDPALGAAWVTPVMLGDMTPGSSVELRAIATAFADVPDGSAITSGFTVESTSYDPVSGNDATTITTNVTALADLTISKAGPSSSVAGDPAGVDYVVVIANEGPSDQVGGVAIVDELPPGTTFDAARSDGSCAANGQTVTCTIPSTIAAGDGRVVHIRALVMTSAAGTLLRNSASVSSGGTLDPDPDNNISGEVATRVLAAPPVSASPSPTPRDLPDTRAVGDLSPMSLGLATVALLLVLFLAALMTVALRTGRRSAH